MNKFDGLFTVDDEGVLSILGNQAGLMLSNSILYDQLVFNQYKLTKLIEVLKKIFILIIFVFFLKR